MKPLKMCRRSSGLKLDVIGSTEERLAEPLSPNAVVFVRTYSAHILVAIGFDSPIDLESFREQLPLLFNHPRFSSLIVGDVKKNEVLKWVQVPNVNIDDHIIVPSIDPALSNNVVAGDKFVEDYLHNLTKTSIDHTSKPPWEFHFLDVKTSEAEYIVILQFHHALGDGISIISHLLAWTRQVSDPDSFPTLATMKKNKMKKEENRLGIDNKNKKNNRCWKLPRIIILEVWWWIQVFWNTFLDVLKFVATMFFLKDSDMLVISSLETVDTNRRRIVFKTISLVDMKFIKNAMNVTINDVAIGIIEAGVSRYLNKRFGNGNKKEDMKSNNILEKKRLRIAMAVNLRPFEGMQGIDDIKNKDTKLGLANEVGVVIMPLSTRLRDDPLEYVRKAKATIDRQKRSFAAKVNIDLCKFARKLFGFKAVGLWTMKAFSHLSIFISNMPGPVEEIAFFGHAVKFIAPTVYGMPSPIMIHLQSCTNKMAIVLAVREDVIIDPHELLDDINDSFLLIRSGVKE